jgi:hypothetical protein
VSVGRFSQLDAATQAKIIAACEKGSADFDRLTSRMQKRMIAFFAILVVAINGLVALSHVFRHLPFVVAPLVLFPLFVGGWIVIIKMGLADSRPMDREYKTNAVGGVVQAVGNGLKYRPTSSLSSSLFEALEMFPWRVRAFHSADEISGSKGPVKYSFHEVRAVGTVTAPQVLGSFTGIIARLEFNKNSSGHTGVIPDSEGRWPAVGLEHDSRGNKSIVRLEDPDFERVFSVYSTDDQQARYLLTPKFMERLLLAWGLFGGGGMRACFVSNYLVIAIPSWRDRFEIDSRPRAERIVDDLLELVSLAEGLIDTLELETRIWTRA